MKLSLVLLIMTSFQLSAKIYSQNITVHAKNAPMEKIFAQIQRQTDYRFFYKDELLEQAGRVSLEFSNAPLQEVLDACFKDQPLSYSIIDKTILVKRKSESIATSSTDTKPAATINGQITDEGGRPLRAVSVKNTTTGKGMETDEDGKFSVVGNLDDVFEFSFVGYKTQRLKITSLSQSINLSMQVEVSSLTNTVVIGYGVVKRSDLTGAVSSVTNADVNRTPTGDLVRALEGQVAGVQIMQPSGTPGGSAIIRVRGANSLTGGNNDPLYVVDGMILSKLGSDFNANDVQSVQVLKDASATAIYGSRGANGVVIITTKRGTAGKTQFSYDGYAGVQQLIKKLDFLNATEYKNLYLESRQNATTNTSIDTSITNSRSNTDWQNEIYHHALIQNHTISVRGGTSQSRYFTSINYFNQDGIIRNTDFTRLSVRFNGDQNLSDRFQLSENILLSYNKSNGILSDEVVSNGVAWARPTQPVLDANGNVTTVSLPSARTNPRSLVDEVVNESINYRVVANLVLDYKIFKGLSVRVNMGTEDNIPVTNYYVPINLTESGFIGSAQKTYGSNISWINENTLNYSTAIGRDHTINAVAGITFQDTKNDFLQGASNGYIINGFQYNNLAAGTIQTSASAVSEYALLSYLGRVNYSFRNKWLVTVSGRYDGSSRLADGHKYDFFPSAALAWKMSEEKFLKNNPTISELKLRGSWGKTGNQTVVPYSTFAQLGTVNVYLDGSPSQSIGYIPSAVSNPNLGWETTIQTDAGIDLGLLNNKIRFTADVYKKNTSDLLFSRITPPSSGYTSAIQNIGEVENKGVEFLLSIRDIAGKTFNWNTTFNFSLNRSKVLDLGKTPDGIPITTIYTNESLGWFPIVLGHAPYQPWGYFVDHIDKTTGAYVFQKDATGANKQGIIGNFEPNYIFGFSNDFSYKNFDLSAFIQGSVGNQVFVDAFRYSLALNGNNNILKSVYAGMGTTYPAPNADYGYSGGPGQNSTALIFDGTYVRLKDITLGYTIPVSKTSGIHSIRVYVSGMNLVTLDRHYPWYDPEVTAGPTANADVVTGWDRGGYANNKSYIIGVKVNW